MKRILIIVCCVMVSVAYVSCTNDEDDTATSKEKLSVSADDGPGGDGQNGQTPISPPKPPKP